MTTGCSDDLDSRYEPSEVAKVSSNSVFELLSKQEDHSLFYNALKENGFEQRLTSDIPLTVLAPSDDIFKNRPEEIKGDALKQYLEFHLIHNVYRTAELYGSNGIPRRLRMSNGKFLNFELVDGKLLVQDTKQISETVRDIEGVNGIIHGIEGLLAVTPNLFEFLRDSLDDKLKEYFTDKVDIRVDFDNSPKTGEFDDEGNSVLDTSFVEYSAFLDSVADLSDGQTEHTVVVTSLPLLNAEIDSFVNHLYVGADEIPNDIFFRTYDKMFNKWIFLDALTLDELQNGPTNLLNQPISIDTGAIISSQTRRLSNGYLYVTSDFTLDESDYLPDVVIDFAQSGLSLLDSISNQDYAIGVQGNNLIYQCQSVGDWVDFRIPTSLLSTEYDVIFDSRTAPSPGDLGDMDTKYTVFIDPEQGSSSQVGDGEFSFGSANEGLNIGSVRFDSVGFHTLRVQVAQESGNEGFDSFIRLGSIRLEPKF